MAWSRNRPRRRLAWLLGLILLVLTALVARVAASPVDDARSSEADALRAEAIRYANILTGEDPDDPSTATLREDEDEGDADEDDDLDDRTDDDNDQLGDAFDAVDRHELGRTAGSSRPPVLPSTREVSSAHERDHDADGIAARDARADDTRDHDRNAIALRNERAPDDTRDRDADGIAARDERGEDSEEDRGVLLLAEDAEDDPERGQGLEDVSSELSGSALDGHIMGELAMLDAGAADSGAVTGDDVSFAAASAGAAESYESWMRHQRPSAWGRLDFGLSWRRRWSEPLSGLSRRYDELWLVATWRR